MVFGHSHIPLDQSDEHLRILNPGSPTDKRRQPHRSLAELFITDGRLTTAASSTSPDHPDFCTAIHT